MTAFHEGIVQANGLAIQYYRCGTQHRRPLLLLHGLTDDGLCWTPVAQALATRYEVVMTDARGHGKTTGPLDDFSGETLARDAAAVIRALGLERPALWGHSMGALAAAALAAREPDLLRAVVLEDPPFRLQPGTGEDVGQAFQALVALRTLTPAERLARAQEWNPLWAEEEWAPWAESKAHFTPDVLGFLGALGQAPWREWLAQITCPILLLMGEPARAAIVTPEMAALAERTWNTGEVVQVRGAGHSIHRDRFQETLLAVQSFLDRAAPGSSGSAGARVF